MQNILDILDTRVSESPSSKALRVWRNKTWVEWSWADVSQSVDNVAKALIGLGHERCESVTIMSCNLPEWTIADMAILSAGGVVVPIYPTSTPDQAEYIVRDSSSKIMFVGQSEQARVALELKSRGSVETVIGLDKLNLEKNLSAEELADITMYDDIALGNKCCEAITEEYHSRKGKVQDSDLATLIYTSGTTGEPKGVMLTHGNFIHQLKMHDGHLGTSIEMDSLAMLPLSHVFERAWTYYVLYRGGRNTYLENPNDLQRALRRFSPTVMCAVPRVYEKMYTTICTKAKAAPKHRQLLFKWALNVGAQMVKARSLDKRPTPLLKLKYKLAKALVLDKIKQKLLPRAQMLPCSGAKLSDEVNVFFQSLGLPIAYGYGMTETTATISCYTSGEMQMGTVGTVLEGLDVKLSDDGNNEILVRGKSVMKGYFNKPDETAEVFDGDWFRTGDAGEIVDGKIILTERIKELMKTSNGKYIAPQQVEGALIQEPLFEQVAVVADCKKFVSALIVPAYEAIEQYGKELGLAWKSRSELLENAEIQRLIKSRLNEAQKHLAHFEQVKVFKLLPREFCMTRGELTPTLKLRRKVIESTFAVQIKEMYGDDFF